jgi:ribonuclease P protein component
MAGERVPRGFGPDRRLRKHAEFVRAQRAGRRVSTAHFTLLVSARPAAADGASPPVPPRLGVVAARKIGGAVQRNRVKRLCRECFREWPDLLPAGVDLVVIARPGADALRLADVQAEWRSVEALLKKRAREALANPGGRHHPAGG